MKKHLFFSFIGCFVLACEAPPKGNPQLVAQAQQIAEQGCKCQDIKCLYDIRVEGKSVIQVLQKSKLDELTKEEKEAFYKASRQYMDCEHALNEKQRKK